MWIVDTAFICLKQGVMNIYHSLSQSNRCEDWSCIHLPQSGLRWVWGTYIFLLSPLDGGETGVRMVDPVWDGCEDSQINGKKCSSNMSEENKYNINMSEEKIKKIKHQTCEF